MTFDLTNNRWQQGLIGVAVLLIIIVLWALAGSGRDSDQQHPPEPTAEDHRDHDHSLHPHQSPGVQLANTPQYTCVMHPHVRSSDPDARCPICGMALIPVSEDHEGHDQEHADEAPSLRLSERAIALSNIRTTPAEIRALEAPVSLPGRLDYDETRRRVISARLSGRLEKLHVNFTGATVEAGDPLVEIYSPELVSAQEELLQAARRLPNSETSALSDTARITYRAARDKLRLLGVSAREIDAIEERGEVQDQLLIQAPVGGVVLTRHNAEGDYVQTGEPLYTMADLSRVWALLDAYETDLEQLALDQRVTLRVKAHPGETFEGRITFIDPSVDGERRTTRVRVELDNTEGQFKPGMLVQGQVAAEQPPALAIPASAPLLTGTRALVYIQEPGDDRRFSAREVELGPRMGDYYPVRSGLLEGDLVVSHGAFRIDSELQIRGQPSMMAPEGNGAPAMDMDMDDRGDHEHQPQSQVPLNDRHDLAQFHNTRNSPLAFSGQAPLKGGVHE